MERRDVDLATGPLTIKRSRVLIDGHTTVEGDPKIYQAADHERSCEGKVCEDLQAVQRRPGLTPAKV